MDDLFSQKIKRSNLEKGDHVYSWRKQIYSHHGIIIGEGKIIHFVNPKQDGFLRFSALSGSSSGSADKKLKSGCSMPDCGSEKVARSGVRLSCIDCFIKKGSIYKFKYEVSREFLLAKLRGGTCTMAKSDSPEEVIHRATYLYENGYGKYDLINNNCEDFALYCKTGLWSTDENYQGRSSQANMVHPTDSATGEDGINEPKKWFAGIKKTFLKRENKDLGTRDDVVKVPVNLLASFSRSLI